MWDDVYDDSPDFTIDEFCDDALHKSIVNYIPIYLLRAERVVEFVHRKVRNVTMVHMFSFK